MTTTTTPETTTPETTPLKSEGYSVALTDLTETTIPATKSGRKPKPNPLLEIVGSRLANRDKAVSFRVPFGTADKADERVKAINSDLSRAGVTHNVMVRRSVTVDEMAQSIVVTFWIEAKPEPKPRKKKSDKADDAATETAEAKDGETPTETPTDSTEANVEATDDKPEAKPEAPSKRKA